MGNLASVVQELHAPDLRSLSDEVLTGELHEIEAAINSLEAARLTRIEIIDRRGGMAALHRSTAAWIRSEFRTSPAQAAHRVTLARDLEDTLPAVRQALADGEITFAHASAAAGLRKDLDDTTVTAIDDTLAEHARVMNPRDYAAYITEVRHQVAPDKASGGERSAFDRRRLHASTTMNGVGIGDWTLDPVSHETVMTAIHAASRPVPDDSRTAAQRRADGLVAIAKMALGHGDLPTAGGVKPHVTVIVTNETLTKQPGSPPATTGYGSNISGDAARMVSCDASIARIIRTPDGQILEAGRATRTFTPAQLRALAVRDKHCRWPSCDRPPSWCEGHHAIHWADGGATDIDNGVLLCGSHHTMVHQHKHAIHIRSDGRRTVNLTRGSANRKGWLIDERPTRAGP